MLIINREINQTIIINDDIYITYLGGHSGQIRLGFKAPREVRIDRLEVREKGINLYKDSKAKKNKEISGNK